jgi:hypothetical protein
MTETLLGRAHWGREQADFGEMKKAPTTGIHL